MAEKDLIHLKPKGDPRSDAIRAKQKGTPSQKRKIAQQINGLKRCKPENIPDKMYKILTNPMASMRQIQTLIEQMLVRNDLKNPERIALIRTCIDRHKTIFGETIHVNPAELMAEHIEKWRKVRQETIEAERVGNKKDADDMKDEVNEGGGGL